MADAVGTVFNIAALLKKAYDLYEDCKKAPEEIRLAIDHIHALTIVLEGVRSDLIGNHRSYVHQTNDVAKSQKMKLRLHIMHCDRALNRMDKLLKKFHSFTHVSAWKKFRWSMEGKKEIADAKEDVVMATISLDLFLSHQGLSVIWKLENMMEVIMQKFDGLEELKLSNGGMRGRSLSMAGRTVVLSLVITRWLKILRRYRRKNMSPGSKSKHPAPASKLTKVVARVHSGFGANKKRDIIMQSYANNIAKASSVPIDHTPRERIPSPDFYYISRRDTTSDPPNLLRRSSSMNRLMDKVNAARSQKPKEILRCWRVGLGTVAGMMKTGPQFKPHLRGQMQLRKLANVLHEASECEIDRPKHEQRGLNEKDKRVRLLLKSKNDKEKRDRTRMSWSLVAARVMARDPGKTGMVSVEKAMVILARRSDRS
ncbi:hypothetical protein CC78DRAFT_532815 [Lojkania enalia]|uniref:Fungal N-terminal domain-containing protein n=1 Tax=Lojkania enalia TaxID=147567 RepID=A0A9P4K994_9PLEO|nr:hypothetical protein CC78DRAFT_532815 [Didymosphaeria enalia]